MERGIDRALEERGGLPRLPAHLEWRTVNGRPKIKRKDGAKSAGVESARARAAQAGRMMSSMRKEAKRAGAA